MFSTFSTVQEQLNFSPLYVYLFSITNFPVFTNSLLDGKRRHCYWSKFYRLYSVYFKVHCITLYGTLCVYQHTCCKLYSIHYFPLSAVIRWYYPLSNPKFPECTTWPLRALLIYFANPIYFPHYFLSRSLLSTLYSMYTVLYSND